MGDGSTPLGLPSSVHNIKNKKTPLYVYV